MNDPIGSKTLEIMARASYYNQWLYSFIKPYLKGNVAEVGAGMGTFSNIIANDGYSVTAIDYSKEYLKIIGLKNPLIKTHLFDLRSPSPPSQLTGKFDSLIILNVIEHLADDKLAIGHLIKMLKKNGHLIVLVPGFQIAFGSLDTYLGHFRRYSIKGFITLIRNFGVETILIRYLNFFGLLGWFVNSRIFHKVTIPDSQVKFFDNFFRPVLKIEKYATFPMGLSLFCVVKKI